MANLFRIILLTLSTSVILAPGSAWAEHSQRDVEAGQSLPGLVSSFLAENASDKRLPDRHDRTRRDRGYEDFHGRNYHGLHEREPQHRNSARHDILASFTSAPIRGGSSRRTRIIENPYPNRPINGISFSGIDHHAVHINDVITYPRKRLISHQSYSLSLHHPKRLLSTRGYVDYISVKAKRKEYFTVTFYYQ
ncbi:MAG: hypothetical protein WDZ52_05930 [Pseudohongiellaceae bacterium]